jgi:hypothetical protein
MDHDKFILPVAKHDQVIVFSHLLEIKDTDTTHRYTLHKIKFNSGNSSSYIFSFICI